MPAWANFLGAPWFWNATALVAVSAVLCALIGVFLIYRRMSLLSDAISHAILPGVVLGYLLGGFSAAAFVSGAVAAGLLCVACIGLLVRYTRLKEDAAMGVVFSAMFAAGIVMLSLLRGVDLDPGCVVYGEPLAAKPESLELSLGALLVVLGLLAVAYRPLLIATFDPVFAKLVGVPERLIHIILLGAVALATVAALRAVGIVLAVAFFITPGATAALFCRHMGSVLWVAALIAAGESLVGMVLAVAWNVSPSGLIATLGLGLFLSILLWQRVQTGNRLA
ncbi:MAG: metal ABC transporter permease [Candidatus Sericytochromatia bacterium]|nr:metal ABC transporter permease [Candidatus Sericytochromatia bacterium]